MIKTNKAVFWASLLFLLMTGIPCIFIVIVAILYRIEFLTCCITPIIISMIFSFFLYLYLSRNIKSYRDWLNYAESVLANRGFVRVVQEGRKISLFGKDIIEITRDYDTLEGKFRDRVITIYPTHMYLSGLRIRGRFSSRGIGALALRTANNGKKAIDFSFDDREKMESSGLGDIYHRLETMGMYGVRDGAAWVKYGPWNLFLINETEAILGVPATLLNETSLIESLEILCDTMDRLKL